MTDFEEAVVEDVMPPILRPEMRDPLILIMSELDVKSASHLTMACRQLLELGRLRLAKVPLAAEGITWNGRLHLLHRNRSLHLQNLKNLPVELHVNVFQVMEPFPSCKKFKKCVGRMSELRVKTIRQVVSCETANIGGKHMEKLIKDFCVQKLYVEHPLPLDSLLSNNMQKLGHLDISGLEPVIAEILIVMSLIPKMRLPSTIGINPLAFSTVVNQWFRGDRHIRSLRFLATAPVATLRGSLLSSAFEFCGTLIFEYKTPTIEVYRLKREPDESIHCHLYEWQFSQCYVRLTRHEQ